MMFEVDSILISPTVTCVDVHTLNPYIATLYHMTDMCMSVLPGQTYLDAQWCLPKPQCKEADSPSSLGQDLIHTQSWVQGGLWIHPGLILEVLP